MSPKAPGVQFRFVGDGAAAAAAFERLAASLERLAAAIEAREPEQSPKKPIIYPADPDTGGRAS